MVISIIKPSFEVPPLEELVKDEQGEPIFTNISHGLQATNLTTLWELFLRSGFELPRGAILDAGCGDGLFFALAQYMRGIGRKTVIGIDLDLNKVKKARYVAKLVTEDIAKRTRSEQRPEGLSPVYVVQDPQDLASMDSHSMIVGGEKSSLPSISMVLSSSVLHWLKEPEKKYAAFDIFSAMLQKGGILCISIPAGGTARDFLQAYNNVVVFKLRNYDPEFNPRGFRRIGFEADPIGSRPLDEIASMIEESGFDIVAAMTLAETAIYPHPTDYSNAVKIYGGGEFLKTFPHYGRKRRERLWEDFEEEFLNILRGRGWQEGQPYTYPQFNNYIIAVKRTISTLPERRTTPVEPTGVTSVLNQKFLTLTYGNLSRRSGHEIEIILSGNPEEIEETETAIRLSDILNGIIAYASSDWIEEDKSPVCNIGYSVLGEETLLLQIDVKTKQEKAIPGILKKGILNRLEGAGVIMGSATLENHVRRYEFRIPLL